MFGFVRRLFCPHESVETGVEFMVTGGGYVVIHQMCGDCGKLLASRSMPFEDAVRDGYIGSSERVPG